MHSLSKSLVMSSDQLSSISLTMTSEIGPGPRHVALDHYLIIPNTLTSAAHHVHNLALSVLAPFRSLHCILLKSCLPWVHFLFPHSNTRTPPLSVHRFVVSLSLSYPSIPHYLTLLAHPHCIAPFLSKISLFFFSRWLLFLHFLFSSSTFFCFGCCYIYSFLLYRQSRKTGNT